MHHNSKTYISFENEFINYMSKYGVKWCKEIAPYQNNRPFYSQNLEVVPLFGDMQIAPFNYIKRSKHFDPSKWPLSSSNNISPQADLMVHLPQIREDHVKYISELARYSNEVSLPTLIILEQYMTSAGR